MEELGKEGNPRNFIYTSLLKYLEQDKPSNPTTYETVVRPAYQPKIEALLRGHYGVLMKRDEKAFDDKVFELIDNDYKLLEPYIETVYKHLGSQRLCVIVIDNVDLYEDEALETKVFSEAISLAKKLRVSVLVSLRDTTYIRHKNDSIFNAHELKRIWLDPPGFKEVLSKRLLFARHVLKGKSANIHMSNGAILKIPDLSVFFDIVQKSLLNNENGDFLMYLSDRNPRRGITLVQNFLSSNHIQADKAISNYLNGEADFTFPNHEVFKGCALGQWKYYKEERAEVINVFDSRINSRNGLLSRLFVLKYLHEAARVESTKDVSQEELIETFSRLGFTAETVLNILAVLRSNALIHSNDEGLTSGSFHLTLAGGYFISVLCKRIAYIEAVLLDTVIFDELVFDDLSNYTSQIDTESAIHKRMQIRKERTSVFLKYLKSIEVVALSAVESKFELEIIDSISGLAEKEYERALYQSWRYHGK